MESELKTVLQCISDQLGTLSRQAEYNILRRSDLRCAAYALRAMCGTRWRNVTKVKLIPGKIYLLRQTYKTVTRPPVVARWQLSGWQEILGQLIIGGAPVKGDKKEVWSE